MLDFTGILPGYEGVTFKKTKCSGKAKWLYSYRDTAKAAKKEYAKKPAGRVICLISGYTGDVPAEGGLPWSLRRPVRLFFTNAGTK